MESKLSTKERARFAACKKQIEEGLQICFDTGAALIEIRDFKLYREEFQTFEEFCETKYKIGKSYAYRLIGAAEVKEALKDSAVGKIVTNEAQARELAKVPEGDRAKLLKSIVRSGEEPTAEAIRDAVEKSPIGDKVQPMKPGKNEKSLIELDECGTPIPKDGLPYWNRRQEVQDFLTQISRIKAAMERAKESRDNLYGVVSNAVIADLSKAYTHISEAKPYAVCTQCMGSPSVQVGGSCPMCKGSGMISKFKWDTVSRKEIKEIRLKSNAQRK